jgi:large subunit ribosomal protein L19
MAMYTSIKGTKVKIGDQVELLTNYLDNGKTKKQKFVGLVIAIKNRGINQSFTVRKIGVLGVGIERIFPVEWPWLESVKVLTHNPVRRAKLYYIRHKIGKVAEET